MAAGSKKVIYAALVGNLAIAATKFAASALTGSSAMLSEAIHSTVDTGNQGLLLWGLHRAKRPPDHRFPLGYGKEIYFWSFVVAILIFAVGGGVSIYEGVKHILHPQPITNPTINYVVIGLALAFEGAAWYIAWRGFRATKGEMGYLEAVRGGKDPTLFVVLFEDSAAILGLLVALAGIGLSQLTGILVFDGIASVIIGLILIGASGWLAHETHGLLIGESASDRVRAQILKLIAQHPGVRHLNELLTLHMGPESILVTVSVDFEDRLSSSEVETAVTELNRKIRDSVPEANRVFIEAEKPRAHRTEVDQAQEP